MTATFLERFGPLLGIALFFSVGIGWRVWLHRTRFGGTGIVLFKGRTGAGLVLDSLLLVLPVVLVGLALAQAMSAAPLRPLGALPLIGPMPLLGAFISVAAVAILALSQYQMGASWRIGIEEGARPGLITHGIYRYSRNPIYAAMFAALAGLVLLMPSGLTLAVLLATYAGVRKQVGYEEDYLRRTYGEPYVAYGRRVGRFLPGIGRFA